MSAIPEPCQPLHVRAALWLLVTGLSALPSFLVAMNKYDSWGMACGIALFTLGYTLVSGARLVRDFAQRPFVKRTLYIGYATRLCLSVVLPIGMGVDVFFGIISTTICRGLFAEPQAFVGTFVTTLVQGTLLNVVLLIYMAVVYLLHRLFARVPFPEGLCTKCGYDLRGSPRRCPECGTPASSALGGMARP